MVLGGEPLPEAPFKVGLNLSGHLKADAAELCVEEDSKAVAKISWGRRAGKERPFPCSVFHGVLNFDWQEETMTSTSCASISMSSFSTFVCASLVCVSPCTDSSRQTRRRPLSHLNVLVLESLHGVHHRLLGLRGREEDREGTIQQHADVLAFAQPEAEQVL